MKFAVWFLCLILCAAGFGQSYTPKAGETVMKIVIEGRGNIFIKLHTKEAPKATNQIRTLASQGFYDGQLVFRAEKSPRPFMIQMGDPQTKTRGTDDPVIGSGGSGKKVEYEDSGYPNDEGAVGLAAIPGDKNSGDSQFYILLSRARFLDGNYTVFGKVVAGMDTVRKVERGDRILSVSILR
ncbi:MAG TPA: peptidylprolyl isomerase [Fimbriimonadaceae bacterium]|nr:peptidylprolyl isomerase [Fimbriimonadaceae bacterium]